MSTKEAEHREVINPFLGNFSIVKKYEDEDRSLVRFGSVISEGSMRISDVYERAWPTSIVFKEKNIEKGLERYEIKVYIRTVEGIDNNGEMITNVYRISYRKPNSTEEALHPEPILRNSNEFAISNQPESEFDLEEEWMEKTELRIGQAIPFSWETAKGKKKSGPIGKIVITSGRDHLVSEFRDLLEDPDLKETDVLVEYMENRIAGERKNAQA